MTEDQKQHMFQYLDDLRETGAINMMGAGPYLQEAYALDRHEARAVLLEWMQSFRRAEA